MYRNPLMHIFLITVISIGFTNLTSITARVLVIVIDFMEHLAKFILSFFPELLTIKYTLIKETLNYIKNCRQDNLTTV